MTLTHKEKLTDDSLLFRFALPDNSLPIGVPIGHACNLVAIVDGQKVSRPYVPVSNHKLLGTVDFAIKIYRKTK